MTTSDLDLKDEASLGDDERAAMIEHWKHQIQSFKGDHSTHLRNWLKKHPLQKIPGTLFEALIGKPRESLRFALVKGKRQRRSQRTFQELLRSLYTVKLSPRVVLYRSLLSEGRKLKRRQIIAYSKGVRAKQPPSPLRKFVNAHVEPGSASASASASAAAESYEVNGNGGDNHSLENYCEDDPNDNVDLDARAEPLDDLSGWSNSLDPVTGAEQPLEGTTQEPEILNGEHAPIETSQRHSSSTALEGGGKETLDAAQMPHSQEDYTTNNKLTVTPKTIISVQNASMGNYTLCSFQSKSYDDDTWYDEARQRMRVLMGRTDMPLPVAKLGTPSSTAAMRLLDSQDSTNDQIDPGKRKLAHGAHSPTAKKAPQHLISGRLTRSTEDHVPIGCAQMDGAIDCEPPAQRRRGRGRRSRQRGLGIERGLPDALLSGQQGQILPSHSRPEPASGANNISIPRPRCGPSGPANGASESNHADPRQVVETQTNKPHDRYEDGEVRRYGAGESYRPYNRDRSPRPARSPIRDRGRTPTGASDSYVPGRSPRRRTRSADRYRRRERSREPESWRRRDRSRSRPPRSPPMRRNSPPPPRRMSPRRSPPPPRYPSPRRDERRDDRSDRARSPPRRDFDMRDNR